MTADCELRRSRRWCGNGDGDWQVTTSIFSNKLAERASERDDDVSSRARARESRIEGEDRKIDLKHPLRRFMFKIRTRVC
jgi:hypothetical protein